MSLHLQITSGPEVGRMVLLDGSTPSTFGRGSAADCCLAKDEYLSREHCILECTDGQWVLRDLDSRHGTFLNDERVTSAELSDRCRILIGESLMEVRLSETRSETDTSAAVALPAAEITREKLPRGAPPIPTVQADFSREKCTSGLSVFRGEQDDPEPAGIAWLLAEQFPMHIIADFSKLGLPLPAGLEKPDFLFNWIDAEILPECSPVVLSNSESTDPYPVIRELWGQDALLCIYSQLKKPELMSYLRAALRGDDGTSTEVPKGILGFCWPDAGRPLLGFGNDRLLSPLIGEIDAILVEAESPACWDVYCKSDDAGGVKSALSRKV